MLKRSSYKEVDTIKTSVPDHLLGITDEATSRFRIIVDKAKNARAELTKLAADALVRISRSEDDVSQRLKSIFDKALSPSSEEMHRARERRERGNPPGKATDPWRPNYVGTAINLLQRAKDKATLDRYTRFRLFINL
jgi:hypothetical protein